MQILFFKTEAEGWGEEASRIEEIKRAREDRLMGKQIIREETPLPLWDAWEEWE